LHFSIPGGVPGFFVRETSGLSCSSYILDGDGMIRMVVRSSIFTLVMAFILSGAGSEKAQTPDGDGLRKTAPRVFIDCPSCDMDYFRTEITFVDTVRDGKDAQIHVLVTTQATGSGGTEYTLACSGQEQFAGDDNVLKYIAGKTDTSAKIRSGLARILKIGLVHYAAKTAVADKINATFQNQAKPTSVDDRWNFWVFSLSAMAYFNGEKSSRYYSLNGSFSANRITPGFKGL
jgi:hypothetical protein